MGISYSFIIAMMFITILSFGFANILSFLAEILNKKNNITVSNVHLNWILLLLIIHFNLTWQAILLTSRTTWAFDSFIFIEIGPILAFFATRILAPSEEKSKDSDIHIQNYLGISKQFFIIFALIQIWGIGIDFVFERGFTGSSVLNILLLALALLFMNIKNYKNHIYGVAMAWVLILGGILLRGFEIIQ
jgi:hypothetical protein